MKRFLHFLTGIILFSGCAAPLVRVIDKKEVSKPFSNILIIYVDGNIDFHFLDSTTYDICVRSCFSDASKFATRSSAEDMLFDRLSTLHTKINKSSDLFTADYNRYPDFIDQINKLGIDAVLLIDFGKFPHTAYNSGTRLSTSPYYFNHADKDKAPSTINSVFQCWLVDVKTKFPVWSAQLDAKGKKLDPVNNNLHPSTVKDIWKSLVDGGYIFPY